MNNKRICLSRDDRGIRKKTWLVRWWGEYDPTTDKQRRYSKSFARKRDAELFMADKIAEFDEGLPRDQHDIILGKLCDKFLATRKKLLTNSTIRDYEDTLNRLKNYFGTGKILKTIRQEDAEAFINNMVNVCPENKSNGNPLADSTRNKILKYTKKIFKTTCEWGYIRKSPFQGIKTKKLRRKPWYYLRPEEFNIILTKVPLIRRKGEQPRENIRIKALYSIMYGCGLRYGEAANLLWDGRNIDFENNRINIINRPGTKDIPSFLIKDYECRSVPLPRWVVDILTKLQSESSEGCPFVFMTARRWARVQDKWLKMRKDGKEDEWENKLLLNNVLRNFKKTCVAAGIKTNDQLTIHCLRKAYGTNLANCSTPAHTLKELMGHASIQTTMEFYLYSGDANEERAVAALDRMMGAVG
jgi:integrase